MRPIKPAVATLLILDALLLLGALAGVEFLPFKRSFYLIPAWANVVLLIYAVRKRKAAVAAVLLASVFVLTPWLLVKFALPGWTYAHADSPRSGGTKLMIEYRATTMDADAYAFRFYQSGLGGWTVRRLAGQDYFTGTSSGPYYGGAAEALGLDDPVWGANSVTFTGAGGTAVVRLD